MSPLSIVAAAFLAGLLGFFLHPWFFVLSVVLYLTYGIHLLRTLWSWR